MLQNQSATSYKRPAEGGVVVNFPEALLVAAKEDAAQFRRRVLVQTLGSLYAQGKISAGLGMQLLACDRWEFYREGFSKHKIVSVRRLMLSDQR